MGVRITRPWVTGTAFLALVAAVVSVSAVSFLDMHRDRPIYPGPGVTTVGMLSTYFAGLAGTGLDTEVYYLEGSAPGATVLVLGGTHPNEPAGFLAAVLLVENAIVERGRLIVIPRANRSGFTCTDPGEGQPQTYEIETPGGPREFVFGSRATNPIHQWPDPVVYVNRLGQRLMGAEVRNLNRSYPGSPTGYPTEQLGYAIVELIQAEKPALAIDLHEASPEYPVINTIVAHPRALGLAVQTSMFLELEGMDIGVEVSPESLRGLSHREWGDNTDTLALLFESCNPAQGRLRGRTDTALVLTGQDKFYVRAGGRNALYVRFTDQGWPLEERVGRHLQALLSLVEIYTAEHPQAPFAVKGIPRLAELRKEGLGMYLHPPE
ncbi:MAG: succinylglutamate desuccinylase [Candidatus Bipolaricaulis sp.]|nr:succinylglutamate desuccinylase [Candidatus Bipolaricaulis sp.]